MPLPRYIWPIIMWDIVIMLYMRVDQVMLREMVVSKEIGIYTAAAHITEVWPFIPKAIYWSVLPSIVEAKVASETLFMSGCRGFKILWCW